MWAWPFSKDMNFIMTVLLLSRRISFVYFLVLLLQLWEDMEPGRQRYLKIFTEEKCVIQQTGKEGVFISLQTNI